jgi:hypothetical protein
MNQDIVSRFTLIYDYNIWNGDWQNTDGYGATAEYTENLRSGLPSVLAKYNITSMLDAGCGEHVWLREVDLGPISYIGADVVSNKIKVNRENFPLKSWIELDVTEDTLPDVDLMLCRVTASHFPFADIKKMLQNFVSSNIQYLLISTFPDMDTKDISDYMDFNQMCVAKDPFNFPEPLEVIDDSGPRIPYRSELHLFRRSDIEPLDFIK